MKNTLNKTILFAETRYIKNLTQKISDEKLNFRNGEKLGDISIRIEDGATVRKIRRIIEKRAGQRYYKSHKHTSGSAKSQIKKHTSNLMKNIYGTVPTGFIYPLVA